jgi:hypothetical protein
MDTDGSDSLDYGELCSQLRRLQFTPHIHLTISDYDVVTQVRADGSPEIKTRSELQMKKDRILFVAF